MKALDKSVETLGLWIVTSRLHSLNLQTRVASDYVWGTTFYDYSLYLVIIRQMPRQFQLLETTTDLLSFLFYLFIYLFFM